MNWKLEERDTGMYTIFEVIDEDGNSKNKNHNLIARFATNDKGYNKIKKKAQLVVAAPELLEALKQSYEMIDTLAGLSSWDARSQDEIDEVMNQMLNAINKAKGADE